MESSACLPEQVFIYSHGRSYLPSLLRVRPTFLGIDRHVPRVHSSSKDQGSFSNRKVTKIMHTRRITLALQIHSFSRTQIS